MKVSIKKGVALLAPFVLFELGYPLAVDQGIFRYNPYLLPLIGLSGVTLYVILLFHNPWFQSKVAWVIQTFSILTSFFILAAFLLLTVSVIVLGYSSFLAFTKQKIAEQRKRDNPELPPTPVIKVPSASEIAEELAKRTPKLRSHFSVEGTRFYFQNSEGPLFADVAFTNDGEIDAHYQEVSRMWVEAVYPGTEGLRKQRDLENRLFEGMLGEMANLEKNAPILQVPRHGRKWMTAKLPITADIVKNMPSAVYFMGRFSYYDENGPHHTDWCVHIHHLPEPIFSCKEHNESP